MRVHGPKNLTRRQVLAGGGLTVVGAGGLTLAGLGGYAWPHPTADSTPAPATPDDTRGVLHFVTRSDLNPPALTIAYRDRQSAGPATDPPYFILAPAGYPLTGPGEPGLMILNRKGDIVWYSPNTAFPASTGSGRVDLKVQSYRGQPVLTWWQGRVITGYGEGQAVIADSSYRTIATVSAGHGLQVDLHEFVITPQDTALITAFRPMPADLSELGGPKQGLGGKRSSFQMAAGATFGWQHDVRPYGASGLSIFDDGASPPKEAQSRAILLDLDTTAMKTTPPGTCSASRPPCGSPAKAGSAGRGSRRRLHAGRGQPVEQRQAWTHPVNSVTSQRQRGNSLGHSSRSVREY